jgi:hypothetical protein
MPRIASDNTDAPSAMIGWQGAVLLARVLAR